jgi:potassium efflux system protein
MRFLFQRSLFIGLGLLAFNTPLNAQLPGLPGKPTKEVAPKKETPDATEERLQQWLKEARSAFARVNEPGAETQLPEGIDAAALADYRRDLEQTILGINRHLKILAAVPEARKALEAARAADAAWTGFGDKPPYSILMIDELVNQQDAIREKAASYRSSLEIFSRTLSGIQEEGRRDEESGRQALADAAENPGNGSAAKWKLTANRAKSRSLALRATYLQSNVALLQDQAETAKIQLSLLERQIAIAKKKPSFNEEDLAKVKKAAADRQAALRKEIAASGKRLQDANTVKIRMQAVLDDLLKATPEGTPLEQTPALALATIKMEAAETRVDSLQVVVETLESLDQLESYGPEAYQNRRVLMMSREKKERESSLLELRTRFDRLDAWEIVVRNEVVAIKADIDKQESRATSITGEDPRLLPFNEIRAALLDKLAVKQRVIQAISTQRRMLKRWLDEFDQSEVSKPLTEKFSQSAGFGRDFIKRLWGFEVFHYDDTVMIGGLPITEKRGVAMGRFIVAFIFFGIAYVISRGINNRLRGVVVRRGHIAEAQAKTLSNWLMLVIGFLLAVATLNFLKIPLTVFAFFGGALAIGLGFGTQTLIKNFICGIIVLFERKVRVGDIVDIGGGPGTITEINTRSSVLRGGDGKETLVPNSLFLENRVTNLTLSNRRVRRMLPVRVAPESSPQAVAEILKECVERHGLILKEPAPIVTFEDFAESANVFGIYYWTEFNDKTNADVVASDLRFMIEKRFSETGIELAAAAKKEPEKANSPDA